MARARFVVPSLPAAGERIVLSPEESAHARSRRLRPGDPVVLFDGSGREAIGRLAAAASKGRGRGAEVVVEELRDARESLSGPSIRLGVAAIRGERLAWVAEKAAELEVETLVLVRTERTQAFRAGEAARERLERLARAGAKQSGAIRWPACVGPVAFSEALAGPESETRLILDASGEPFPVSLPDRPCALLVGPEGGWTDGEREAARHAGWRPVALPAVTLRAETAAVAAVVLARAALFRGRAARE